MNGEIALDSVTVGIPQASLNLRFDNQPVKITDSKLNFNQFKILHKVNHRSASTGMLISPIWPT